MFRVPRFTKYFPDFPSNSSQALHSARHGHGAAPADSDPALRDGGVTHAGTVGPRLLEWEKARVAAAAYGPARNRPQRLQESNGEQLWYCLETPEPLNAFAFSFARVRFFFRTCSPRSSSKKAESDDKNNRGGRERSPGRV